EPEPSALQRSPGGGDVVDAESDVADEALVGGRLARGSADDLQHGAAVVRQEVTRRSRGAVVDDHSQAEGLDVEIPQRRRVGGEEGKMLDPGHGRGDLSGSCDRPGRGSHPTRPAQRAGWTGDCPCVTTPYRPALGSSSAGVTRAAGRWGGRPGSRPGTT